MTALPTHADAYFQTVASVDPQAATDLVLRLLEGGVDLPSIATEVLGRAQQRVGGLWEQGHWSVADEHAATAVTETALAALVHAGRPVREAETQHVLLACVQGEWHMLPARLAAAAATAGAVRVTMLGPSLPAEQLGRRLDAGDVDVLALSCTMSANLLGAARCVQVAHDRGIPVLAGGAGFGPDARRAHAVGADAWSSAGQDVTGPAPALAGRPTVIPVEALLLESLHETSLDLVGARLVAMFPALHGADLLDRIESLRWLGRCAAAAVLTGDASILDDQLAWASRVLGDWAPAASTSTAAYLLAEHVERECPQGAALLHDAADRAQAALARTASAGTGAGHGS